MFSNGAIAVIEFYRAQNGEAKNVRGLTILSRKSALTLKRALLIMQARLNATI
jgi:hypothetical protein